MAQIRTDYKPTYCDYMNDNLHRTEATNQSNTSFGVFLLGVDRRMQHALEFFFTNTCNNKFHIADSDAASITIIDIDNSSNLQLWEVHASNYPEHHIILLSLQEFDAKGIGIVLRKPVDTNQLLKTIEKIADDIGATNIPEASIPRAISANSLTDNNRTSPESDKQSDKPVIPGDGTHTKAEANPNQKEGLLFISTAPDIDLNDPAQTQNARYNPKSFLIGYLQMALNMAKMERLPVRLLSIYQDTFIIDPKENEVLAGMNERRLRALSSVPHPESKFSFSIIRNDELKAIPKNEYVRHNIESIMWKVALWGARGRVPAGTNFTHPIVLDGWPNLTRLQVFPHAVNIAAFLMQQPQSLIDTVKILNVPQRCVFSFYSAANAIGLAYPAQQNEGESIQPIHVKQHKDRKLLSRLLGRLRMLSDS